MLTDKQRIFIKEYLIDMNASAAYRRAGYTAIGAAADSCAHKLLRNAEIKSEIDKALDKRSEKVGIDADWVLQRLKEISDRCMQAEPILNNQGEPTGEYRFDSSGANRSTELIAKHLGMFSEKMNISGDIGVQIIDNVPDE